MEKVTGSKRGGASPQKHIFQDKDPNDLCRFLEKGTPARFGGRNPVRPKPYHQQPRKFQKKGVRRTNNETFDSRIHNFDQSFSFPYPMCISSPYSKPAPPLYPQLALFNNRSLSSASGEWLQTRTDVTSSSEVTTFGLRDKQGKSSGRGDSEAAGKGGNKGGF